MTKKCSQLNYPWSTLQSSVISKQSLVIMGRVHLLWRGHHWRVRGRGGCIGSSLLIHSSIFFGNVRYTEINNKCYTFNRKSANAYLKLNRCGLDTTNNEAKINTKFVWYKNWHNYTGMQPFLPSTISCKCIVTSFFLYNYMCW